MARPLRLTVPGYPHHVILRGNNRQAVVLDDEDRRRLLEGIGEQAGLAKVAIHTYVLMSNHLHLLLTPETADGIPHMMQALGRSYVRAFNRRHGRSGTLWEGRYRSTLIEAERYLLACMAYIDLNPVRAGMVAAPADFAWSSHAHHVGQRNDPLVTPHALYWEMGDTPFARERAYGELVSTRQQAGSHGDLARAVHAGWALGGEAFLDTLATQTSRRVSKGKAGRPPKLQDPVQD